MGKTAPHGARGAVPHERSRRAAHLTGVLVGLAIIFVAAALAETVATRGWPSRWLDAIGVLACTAIVVDRTPPGQLLGAVVLWQVCVLRRRCARADPRVPGCAIVRARWQSFRS